MKHLLLTTIAAVVLVGCVGSPTPVTVENKRDNARNPNWPDVEAPDEPITVLYEAMETGNVEYIENFLAKDIWRWLWTAKDSSPLYVAIMSSTPLSPSIVSILIEHGADVNHRVGSSKTNFRGKVYYSPGKPLIHAAQFSGFRDEVTRLLLQNGAKVDAKDAADRTALFYAAQDNHVETAKVLLSYGANVNSVDKGVALNGIWKTPLDFAYEGKRKFENEEARKKNEVNWIEGGLENLYSRHSRPKKNYDEIIRLLIRNGAKTGEELEYEMERQKLFRRSFNY